MGTLQLSRGFPLSEFPQFARPSEKPGSQAVDIRLSSSSLSHVAKRIKLSSSAVKLVLGEKSAIYIDDWEFPIQILDRSRKFLYRRRAGEMAANLTASFSCSTRGKPPPIDDFDANDKDILALQQSMLAANQKNQTLFVANPNSLPPERSAKTLSKSALAAYRSPGKNLFDDKSSALSTPGSPSLGGTNPVQRRTPAQIREEAVRKALIHFLASKSRTEEEIRITVGGNPEILRDVIKKTTQADKDEPKKLVLLDRCYKEFDPWDFGYSPSHEEDRQEAIRLAIKAFDRLRIPPGEYLWQKLLPKQERGKGIVLSKLKLSGLKDAKLVSDKKSNWITKGTKRTLKDDIKEKALLEKKARKTEKEKNEVGDKKADSGTNRQRMEDRKKKEESTEKKKGPESRTTLPESKKRPDEKNSTSQNGTSAKPAAIATTPQAAQSKKPAPKKAPPVAQSKFKSEEYIVDSDDSDDPMDIDGKGGKSVTPSPLPPKKTTKKVEGSAAAPKKSAPKAQPSSKATAPGTNKKQASQDGLKAAPMARTLSHQRKNSSPVKPSPLGSSPPANASDIENDKAPKASKSSSSSSSPLINQRLESTSKAKVTKKARDADDGSSDRTLKRKANDINSDVNNHNGKERSANYDRPTKRQHTSSVSSAASNDETYMLSTYNIELSKQFKKRQQQYVDLHRRVQAMANPPQEKVERLHRMFLKLKEQKAYIWSLKA